jgi:OmpA-OmpF porin, OOP family
MSSRLCAATLVAASLLCAHLQAHAQSRSSADSGGYAFAAVGRSEYNNDCTGVSDCKNNGTALKLGGGYRFGGGWALEGVYLNFGTSSGTDTASRVKVEFKANGVGLGGAFFADLAPNFFAVLRLGVANIKVDGTGTLSNFRVNLSERSTNVYSGFGLAYAFTPMLYGELAIDATRAKFQGETSRLSAFSAGLGLRF